MRRMTAAVSAVLLSLLTVAVAEAALLVLLLVFASVLRLNLVIQLGERFLQMWAPALNDPTVTVRDAGTIASFLFTFGCGAGAAIWRHRRWASS
jgi:hypothetical protein